MAFYFNSYVRNVRGIPLGRDVPSVDKFERSSGTEPAPASITSLPPQVNISLNHQQDELNRLTLVMQQW